MKSTPVLSACNKTATSARSVRNKKRNRVQHYIEQVHYRGTASMQSLSKGYFDGNRCLFLLLELLL